MVQYWSLVIKIYQYSIRPYGFTAFRSWSAASRPTSTALFLFVYFFNKKEKTIKAADNFVQQCLHQSLLSPEALLKQYIGRQISYRCYLCSHVCIQVWAYAHARVSCSFESPDQVYDIKRGAWRSVCLLASLSERVGVDLRKPPCFTVRSVGFHSCESTFESVEALLNYWKCPSLYNEIGT